MTVIPRLDHAYWASNAPGYPSTSKEWDSIALGQSNQSHLVQEQLTAINQRWRDSIAYTREPESERFERLANSWEAETAFSSSLSAITAHGKYLQIIGMGPAAVPMIIRRLKSSPNYWFTALTAITGQDPIIPSDYGDLYAMTNSWINWANTNGIKVSG